MLTSGKIFVGILLIFIAPAFLGRPTISEAEELNLRVEKYTGLRAPDGMYDKEAIRITNLGRSMIAIKRVTLNDGQCILSGDTRMGLDGSFILQMGDFATEWLCSGSTSILRVQIETMEYNGTQWVSSGSTTYTLK